jgi:TonB family protein
MRYILMILFVLFNSVIFCQKQDSVESPVIEFIPTIINSSSGLGDYLKENLIYPEYAYKNKISGTVFVCFTVDANKWVKKHVTNVHVIRSIHPSLDFAAINTVLRLPDKWNTPARGTCDTVRFVYPVKFDLGTVKPEQISDCFDKRINELLAMDSTTLNSILYKDKPVNRELYIPPVTVENNKNTKGKTSAKYIEIKGTVFDLQDKSPMPFVEIHEIGTTNATLSDYNGDFSLTVNKKSELRIFCKGYVSQNLKIKRAKLNLRIYLYK